MGYPYARGKYAYGFCDKTGFRYPLGELVYEVQKGVKTGLRVGRDIFDPDQPQNWVGVIPVSDPQALFDPRPTGATSGRGLFAWDPVGDGNSAKVLGDQGLQTMRIASAIGTVTVTTS
jgi:hypothetical protein|tara:strand:- start:169 stop:522 length:354 start_codon:yes stop_codon:yes gene_type:complete